MFDALKEQKEYHKKTLSDARFNYYYKIIPYFLIAIASLLLISVILILINFKKLGFVCAILFLLSILVVIAMFSVLPFVRKKELKNEIELLKDMFAQPLLENPETEYILPRDGVGGVVSLSFDEDNIKIDKLEYSYEGFECAVCTSNYLNKINLIAVFKRTEKGDKEDGSNNGVMEFSLKLDTNLMSIIEKHNIRIVNQDVYNFIKGNIEVSAKQIFKYGKIQNNYYKVK